MNHHKSKKIPTITLPLATLLLLTVGIYALFMAPLDSLSQTDTTGTTALDSVPGITKSVVRRNAITAGWSSGEIAYLDSLLSDKRTRWLPTILEKNATHVEATYQYKSQNTPEAVSACLLFYNREKALLDSLSEVHGVSPFVITAILKVESNLGGYFGRESIFNVFWTLATGGDSTVRTLARLTDPDQAKRLDRRARWARGQLRDLLGIALENKLDPLDMKGSWAGAFGFAQFIPSSYKAYGVDGDGDNRVDLFTLPDAVASIGNYLKRNGWRDSSDFSHRKKVIMTYNISSPYAESVLGLADSIRAKVENP